MLKMSVKERVLNVFKQEKIDRIPFVSYPWLIPIGEKERYLRNNGFGYWWIVSPLIINNTNTERESIYFYDENKREYIKNKIKTKKGEIFEIIATGGGYGSSLKKEFFLKTRNDYKIFEQLIKEEEIKIEKEMYKEMEDGLGEDGIIVSWVPKTPFQSLLYELIGPKNFAFHLYDFKEEFLNLYNLLFKRYLKICEILSESDFEFFEIADNITSEMIGLERFKEFIIPVYEKTCEIFHSKNKKIGSHMDGNLKILKEEIEKTKLDFIDAFTPFPDTDLSLEEAKDIWGNKIIVINFPSSIHLKNEKEIENFTEKLIEQVYPCDKFIINITENVPGKYWEKSFKIINDVLNKYGEVPKL